MQILYMLQKRAENRKELNLGWDDPISDSLKQRWMGMLQFLKSAEAVRLPHVARWYC